MLEQRFMLGQLSFLGANGQLVPVPAGSMLPGTGLTSAAFPSSAYAGMLSPAPGGSYLVCRVLHVDKDDRL